MLMKMPPHIALGCKTSTIILLLLPITFKSDGRFFFEEVIQKKFEVTDFWWRYEWQHRGSSHVHGFLWLKNAPSVDDLDRNNVEAVQNYINFWDQHISTWHPDKHSPPAAIHPSARLFNTLD